MEFLMPKTPTEEDLKEFYRQTGIDIREMFSHSYFLPQVIPGCMYEYMLKTIAPYTVRGVLWYQGEGDTPPGRNVIYKDMLTALIGDWRQLWNNEELPFLVVQIPGWRKYLRDDMNSTGYKVLRERQQETADTVPGVYLCSISDAGEEFDIHPKDKKTVGERLALLAEGHVYGQDILCDALRAAGFERENNCITVSFDHAPGGLYSKEPEISALEIYEGERQVPFKAWAEGNCVKIVLEKETEETVEIRFAQTGWYLVNLYNQAGIPAIPFKARV